MVVVMVKFVVGGAVMAVVGGSASCDGRDHWL